MATPFNFTFRYLRHVNCQRPNSLLLLARQLTFSTVPTPKITSTTKLLYRSQFEPYRFGRLLKFSTTTSSGEQDAAQETAKIQYRENMKRNTRIAFYVLGGTIVATVFGSIYAYGKPHVDPSDGSVVSRYLSVIF